MKLLTLALVAALAGLSGAVHAQQVGGGGAGAAPGTPYHLSGGTTAGTNSTSIKGSAGVLYHVVAINPTATLAYLRLYDSATAPTCSSATGVRHVYPVPANTSGAGFVIPTAGPAGEAYVNGIGFCVTGAGGDTDMTNAPAGVFVEASYH